MLTSVSEIEGHALEATDGELGKVKDCYFDDRGWRIRYLVADTGTWLPGRKVLLAPEALGEPDADAEAVPVHLSQEQVREAPSVREDEPVSRQHEQELVAWFGWAPYWVGPAVTGGVVPVPVQPADWGGSPSEPAGDDHLRSADEVSGYRVEAADGDEVGHVEDFIIDPETWTIQYLVIDTRNGLPGRHVLVAPAWVRQVDWAGKRMFVQMTGDQVRNSPEYDPSEPIDRRYEDALHEHYGRAKYWEQDSSPG